MILICAICRGVLKISIDDIFFTPCGHLFHFQCLSQWLQSSETCPQCHSVTTSDKIHKAHFSWTDDLTVDNSENISLQERIDDLKFQVLEKERDVQHYIAKNASLEIQNAGLRQKVREVESEISLKNSTICDLKNKDIIKIKSQRNLSRDRLKKMTITNVRRALHRKKLWQENQIKQLEQMLATHRNYLLQKKSRTLSIEECLKTYEIENSSLRHRITELETTLLHVAPSNN